MPNFTRGPCLARYYSLPVVCVEHLPGARRIPCFAATPLGSQLRHGNQTRCNYCTTSTFSSIPMAIRTLSRVVSDGSVSPLSYRTITVRSTPDCWASFSWDHSSSLRRNLAAFTTGIRSAMDYPSFPLPLGHTFGLSRYGSIMVHDGKADPRHQSALRQWQSAYKGRLRRPRFEINGIFDGPTQRAVAEVQKLAGLPVTGMLGPDEWALVWTLSQPKGAYVRPGGEHAERQREQHKANVKDYWRRYSKWDIHPGSDPNAPAWFPGRPFGYRERGEHVKPVQEFFGLKPNGRFSSLVATKVRGFQKTRGLPISGYVDARTASYIQAEIDQAPEPPAGSGA